MPRILISGASGLIGSALLHELKSRGYEVIRLVRRPAPGPRELQWEPMREVSPGLVSGFDAVIHLSGESVAGRWTAEKKHSIRESRVVSTRNLASALVRAAKPPHTFLCASAIGYYGDRGDEVLTEGSQSGTGFLPEVCREWEGATDPAMVAGIRVVNLRFGIVLSREGGALKQMLLPFRLGLGGRIGSGRQWWSWIHIEDAISAILHILNTSVENTIVGSRASSPGALKGPINLVSPNPVTNVDFTRALAHALRRPAFLSVPAFAAKLAFGEFAKEGPLASARVAPQKLLENGFEFRYPGLETALANLLPS